MKRIVVSVSNHLSHDQRVHKICSKLLEQQFDVLLIGRNYPKNISINRKYKTHRFNLLFNRGFLFYAEFNIRLFFKLIFLEKDVLLANDLDTLLPNFLIGKIFGKKIIYDSHELFTEVPELKNRPLIKKIWLTIEKICLPSVNKMYTVNHLIADFYHNKYGINCQVVRNISNQIKDTYVNPLFAKNIKKGRKMLILQGTGINIDRGAEEAIEMMQYLEGYILYIIGSGDVFEKLKQIRVDLNLQDSVKIIDRLPYNELIKYTLIADLGLSLDKNTNLNYQYSLPNKIFDYIQTETPILASNRPLIESLVKKYQIGAITASHNPKYLAEKVETIFKDKSNYETWKSNLRKLKNKYCWENESKKLMDIF